jgi:hypothetical protein
LVALLGGERPQVGYGLSDQLHAGRPRAASGTAKALLIVGRARGTGARGGDAIVCKISPQVLSRSSRRSGGYGPSPHPIMAVRKARFEPLAGCVSG